MLTAEVGLMWTEEGVAPFRHRPEVIVPYAAMTKRQLACVLEALNHAVDAQLVQTCPKSTNGICVYVASLAHAAVKAEPSLVLYAVVRVVRQTPALQALPPDALCQRVLDQMHMSVCIARHVFTDARRLLQADADRVNCSRK